MKSKIVLDTNVLIQSIPRHSKYHPIWKGFAQGKYILCVSNEILNEYEEIIERLAGIKAAKLVIDAIISSPFALLCNPYFNFRLIESDPDDNKFVDCAVGAGARCIVTQDHHYDILWQVDFPKIAVERIDDFLQDVLKL